MRAHLLDADGWIVNTVNVPDLDFAPSLIDAAIGGQIGDRVVDGVLIYVVTAPPPGWVNPLDPPAEDPPVDEPETPPA